MTQIWRLIPPLYTDGVTQMAVDRWLFEQHAQGLQPPSLRFYTWQPVTISLGFHQRHYPQHWSQLCWQNQPIPCVRRPTGGRAVLHQGDLTYAVITSGVMGSRLDGYRYICQFLIQGWQQLGIDLHYGQGGRSYIHNPNCFGSATGADLVLPDGNKLIGSAQLRHQTAILQHGSMRLQPHPELFAQVFGAEASYLPRLPSQLQGEVGMAQIMASLSDAAQQVFGATLVCQSLSEQEWMQIRTIAQLHPIPGS
jgi:lipoate-protein ligase A